MMTYQSFVEAGDKLIAEILEAEAEYKQARDPVDQQHALFCALIDWRNANRGHLPEIDWKNDEYDDNEPCMTIQMAEDLVRILLHRFVPPQNPAA